MPTPLTLDGLDVQEHLRDPRLKQHYVTTVFEIVAGSYDRFTRFCSLGMDMAWKRELLALVKGRLRPDQQVLDLATGTGDLVFSLAPSVRHGKVIGIDISEQMVLRADQLRRRRRVPNAEFRVGDMMHLPVADDSVDLVTVSYGLRNCPDVAAAAREVHRVLKPGGFVASLDFVRPESALWQKVFCGALLLACNFYGWLWHRQPAVYGYLAHSISHFLSRRELSRMLGQIGLEVVEQRPKLLGTVCIHFARKRLDA
jgi:demethylmenaquinone methyltransferase / 2-methoxy-6-polyprenyl-1,4-benzoquinol methylase